jgi:hypothetical protein
MIRAIVQDSHLNFLIGAGTSSSFFARLGNVEEALTELSDLAESATPPSRDELALARASIYGYFFENVLLRNSEVLARAFSTIGVRDAYKAFLQTLNRILLKRGSSLLAKQANIFTTNVDMLFEVALEELSIDYSDGFSGRILPRFDLGDFGTARYRLGSRYEHRSEVPVVNLFKLHGSASWGQDAGGDGEITFDHGLTRVASIDAKFQAAKADLLLITGPDDVDPATLLVMASGIPYTASARDFADEYATLAIVNPDKRKFATTVLNKTYYELARRFSNELEKENSVLFVHGFSFRDEHLRDLVLRAARTNPTLLVVVFCYTSADRDSYRTRLDDRDVKNGNIRYIVPATPESGESERAISLDVLESEYLAPIIADMFSGRGLPDRRDGRSAGSDAADA